MAKTVEISKLVIEETVASLLETAASDKNQVAEEIEGIKSNVALVKTGLTSKIDNLAVSWLRIFQQVNM